MRTGDTVTKVRGDPLKPEPRDEKEVVPEATDAPEPTMRAKLAAILSLRRLME